MTKLKKDTESIGQGIKKVIENIGHEIKEKYRISRARNRHTECQE